MSATAEASYQRHKLSVSDFHRMEGAGVFAPEERVELVEGEIIDMSPIGSAHAGVVDFLAERLFAAVTNHARVRVQNPVLIDERTEVHPDLTLVARRDDFFRERHPQPDDAYLVIEVSDTSLRYDRDVKLPLYARAGIVEVWIVDLETRALTVHRRPEGHTYTDRRELREPAALTVAALPGITIDLSGLFGQS
ncbi:MAG: Uma2 family endonuclease [Rhodospirillales bacterium]|nr:Uma2 family endonuclease [Rhodospirillales bacterium]